MKTLVIGSGHAGISAAEGLIERGIKPVILDVGETLDTITRNRVNEIAAMPRDQWPQDRDLFPAATGGSGRVLRKTVFGADYIYAQDHPLAPMAQDGTSATATFAKGGFSIGWGGAVLPARPEDLTGWPFAAERLDPHYGDALKEMPLSAANDILADSFPLFTDDFCPLKLTDQGQGLLRDLNHARSNLGCHPDKVLFGQARLAMRADGCVHCGLCLSGCPYGVIYTLDAALDRYVAAGTVDYRPNAFVMTLEESGDAVSVSWIDTKTDTVQTDTFDRVFVAAGALGSARLMLRSLRAFDHAVPLLDSAKFALPLLRLPSSRLEWPDTNTLADLFIEAVFADIAPNWLHVQISPLNEMMLKTMRMVRGRQLNVLGRIASPLIGRMMVAWCGMHSSLSTTYELRLSPAEGGRAPALNVRVGEKRSAKAIRAYGRGLAGVGRGFRTLFVPQTTLVSPPCSTGHCGGSFPMRKRPMGAFESDVLGRPNAWRRTHLVDSSVFPSIPGTTIALLIRANARRIVREVDFTGGGRAG
jgi:choline dehydrogenase-like flavoprotein